MQVVDACETPLAEPAQDVTQADDTYQVCRLIAEENAVDLGGGHALHHTTNSLFAPAYGVPNGRDASATQSTVGTDQARMRSYSPPSGHVYRELKNDTSRATTQPPATHIQADTLQSCCECAQSISNGTAISKHPNNCCGVYTTNKYKLDCNLACNQGLVIAIASMIPVIDVRRTGVRHDS